MRPIFRAERQEQTPGRSKDRTAGWVPARAGGNPGLAGPRGEEVRAIWGARAVIGYAFDARGLDLGRIEADLDPHNQASARLLERLGFAREGLLRERWTVAGVTTDSLIMGLLRREWRP